MTCKINHHQAGMIHVPSLGALVCAKITRENCSGRFSDKGWAPLTLKHPQQHKARGVSGTSLNTEIKS